MTDESDVPLSANETTADSEIPQLALPEAIYRLQDDSYGDRDAYDADRSGIVGGETPLPPWGKGALLLNPSTSSYLTPYGFKVLFEQYPKVILDRFERAGLNPDEHYFQEGVPDILIHTADGHFTPASKMGHGPLTGRFREEDIYLQNFNRDGTKRTGSYTHYARASDVLKELHANALAGGTSDAEDDDKPENAAASKAKTPATQRALHHRPRGRGIARRDRKAG